MEDIFIDFCCQKSCINNEASYKDPYFYHHQYLLVQVHIYLFQGPVVWLGIGSGIVHLVLLILFPYRKLR